MGHVPYDSFNSIKVRLIHEQLSEMPEYQMGFNSIKVRLILRATISTRLRLICFNSIKVRLIPGINPNLAFSNGFQFHKGSINTAIIKREKAKMR